MSISSMTNIAILRHAGTDVTSYKAIDQASGNPQIPQTEVTAALKAIASYIPSEILTVYVAVLAVLQQADNRLPSDAARLTFWIFLVLTPVVVLLVHASKVVASKNTTNTTPKSWWPVWEMIAATIAFVAWAMVLPDNPFQKEGWYSASVAAIAVLLVSMLLGLISPLVNTLLRKNMTALITNRNS
jgi:hypothetical protein